MRNYLLAGFLLICFTVTGQTFEVDTVFKNGKLNERINLVFVGDGYKADELDTYMEDVNEILSEIFNQSPFKEYKNYFNAFAVNVISNQSGASHPKTSSDSDCVPVPAGTVDNYFGSTFDAGGIHRLLVPTKGGMLANVLAEHFPQFDQVFVVVNTSYYGGSGGFYATGSTHPSGKEVAIHEIGHSFALLADEYWAGPQYASEHANMTQQSSAASIKWRRWLGDNDIGIYPHTESPSWKRPHQNCKMRALGLPFCSVCTEAFVERIHVLAEPLASYSPEETTFAIPLTQTIDFSLSLVKPEPNTLKISWEKDYQPLAENQDMISVNVADLGEGAFIRATIIDTAQLTRSTLHETNHVFVVEWEVGNPVVTGIPVTAVESKYIVSTFPNPVGDELNFSYTLQKPTAVNVSLWDGSGKKIKTIVQEKQLPGEHSYHIECYERPGQYILRFEFNKATFSQKIMKQ